MKQTTRHHLPDSTGPSPAPTVLHVRTIAGGVGGPDKTIVRSPRHIDPARYHVAAAYIHPAGDPAFDAVATDAERCGCELHSIAERSATDWRTVAALYGLCRRLNVRIWHGHDYKSNALGLLLRPLHRMKLATTAHGWTDDTRRMRLYRRIDEMCLRRYERVIAVSSPLHDRCREIGVRADRLTTIHNAIDADEFRRRHDTGDAKATIGVRRDATVIGVVGRLSIEKGVDRCIGPLAELRRLVPNLVALLIGDGPQRGELESHVRRHGLERVVRFCGRQTDLPRWYEAMDLLLLPSRTEGLPNVLLEAMAMGVPVAAAQVGGVNDLIERGKYGVPLGDDPATWSNTLRYLIADGEKRRAYAALGRQRVESAFSFEARMRRIVGVYDELLGATDGRIHHAPVLRIDEYSKANTNDRPGSQGRKAAA